MKKDQVRKAVLAAGAGAVLAGGALWCVPDLLGDDGPPPAPGPAARAMTATAAGAQASLPDLVALIGDREKWVRAHPADEESWAVLGAAYVERGVRAGDARYYPRAERALNRSLAVLPGDRGNLEALVGLGALANARGDYGQARRWAEIVQMQKPKRWRTYPVLLDAYYGLGDYKKAGAALDSFLELRSGGPALGVAVQGYRMRGWREDAQATAVDAVARADSATEKAAALVRLADLAWERGDTQEALAGYESALQVLPGHAPALAGKGRALGALGRTDDAFQAYQRALAKLPLPEYALEAGELYESLGLDGDARTQYDVLRARAAEAGTHGVNEALVLARFETDHGDPEAAVTRLRAEWGRGHRSVQVADALGWALFRAGEPKDALAFAKRAHDQGLRSALFAYHRGEIERSLERYGEARRHLEEALRINPDFSPLLAPRAKEALEALGEPPEGGPRNVHGYQPKKYYGGGGSGGWKPSKKGSGKSQGGSKQGGGSKKGNGAGRR
ncbi:tetratricopeptide repeat protein [Streptomyces sp. NPDC001941]|uniref:tetratricopeptide repeat protein n=1 Tax=Streptomyces sp. NPDC001941 TaxID=3154659 RepID=UPI0033203F87